MSEIIPNNGDPVFYQDITLENIDRAMRDWFDKTVSARVKTPQDDAHKVPVIFSSGERWSTGRTRQVFRDDNGVLILPIISLRRVGVEPDPTKMALGVQTDKIQIAVRIDPKTSQMANLQAAPIVSNLQRLNNRPIQPPVYDVYTIPFPDRMIASYQVVIQAQFIGQMNDILQKIWRMLDIQKSFVAPLENNGRVPPRVYQYGGPYENVPRLKGRYVVGFMESTSSDGGNFEEFSDQERIVKYTTEIKVPFALQTSPEGEPAPVRVERTSFNLSLGTEVVRTGTF